MAFLRAQVRLTTDTGAQRDVCVNTLHFITDELLPPADEAAEIQTELEAVYLAVDSLLSENLATTAEVRYYDMEHPPDRVPIHVAVMTLTPGTTSLPNQLAVCVNLQADLVSGEPRGRSRGRVFMGPLSQACQQDHIGDIEIPGAARNTFGNAWGGLLPSFDGGGTGTYRLCVFSKLDALGIGIGGSPPSEEPTYTGAQLSAGFKPVTSVRIADRLSVQRSRRKQPTEFITYT